MEETVPLHLMNRECPLKQRLCLPYLTTNDASELDC